MIYHLFQNKWQIYIIHISFLFTDDLRLFLVWVMVLNATFNTNAAISWRSVLLEEETGVSGENHRPAVSQ